MIIANILLAGLSLLPQSRGRWVESSYGPPGDQLRYRLYLPEGYESGARMPLVVMLHGCTQTAEDFARGTRMQDLAESRGFLLLFPEQRPDAHPQRCWNWYEPAHQGRGAGEPALIAGLTRHVAEAYVADPDRVYVGGVSAGGAMSVNVAAAYPELFAAVGVHSGVGFAAARSVAEALRAMREGPADPLQAAEALRGSLGGLARAIPLFVMHGSDDSVVAAANSDALAAQWAGVMGSLAGGGEVRTQVDPGEEGGRAYTRATLRRAPDGPTLVEHWTVEGLGHAWSGGDPAGSYADAAGPAASREMIRFFLDNPRPRGGS